MGLRTRLLAALPVVGLFALLPGVDSRARLAQAPLRVHEWLLGDDSPLAGWRHDGIVPPLAVDLLTSPPIEDDTERAAAAAKYAAASEQWAAARSAAGEPTRVDAARGRLPLLVHVGERGIRAETAAADGAAVVHAVPFATALSLLPAFVAALLLVLVGRAIPALLAGALAGAIAHAATAVPGRDVAVLDAVTGGGAHFLFALARALQQPMLVAAIVAAAAIAAVRAPRRWLRAVRTAAALLLALALYRVTSDLGAGSYVAVPLGIAPSVALALGAAALLGTWLAFRRRPPPAQLPQ